MFVAMSQAVACSPNFRAIHAAPFTSRAITPRARVHVEATSLSVTGGSKQHISPADTEIASVLGVEIERALGASGAVDVVDNESQADVVVEVTMTLNGEPSGGAIAWAILNGLLLTAPSILGAPFGWFTITTTMTFNVRDRDGRQVGRHVAQNQHGYVYGYYWGHHVFDSPYEEGLADGIRSFLDYFRTRWPAIAARRSAGIETSPRDAAVAPRAAPLTPTPTDPPSGTTTRPARPRTPHAPPPTCRHDCPRSERDADGCCPRHPPGR